MEGVSLPVKRIVRCMEPDAPSLTSETWETSNPRQQRLHPITRYFARVPFARPVAAIRRWNCAQRLRGRTAVFDTISSPPKPRIEGTSDPKLSSNEYSPGCGVTL